MIAEELPKEEVADTIFQNGTFEELTSVKNWINLLKDKDRSEDYIKKLVNTLKRACLGKFDKWNIDLVKEGIWCYKHPNRLTVDDARQLERTLKDRNFDTASVRMPLRSFFRSKGDPQAHMIRGGKPKGHGKYADLYVERERLDKMLEWIKGLNHEAYLTDRFMFLTATRIKATLNAQIVNIKEFEDHAEVKVFDKGVRAIYPEGHPWIKYLKAEYYYKELKPFISESKGTIFQISSQEMCNINQTAIKQFCPELIEKYGRLDWNHFWRHMFAQHMLRLTHWNYGVVAFLGGWTVQALQESYGKPTEEQIKEWGLKEMPKL